MKSLRLWSGELSVWEGIMPENENVLSLNCRTTSDEPTDDQRRIAALEIENEMLRGKLGYGQHAGKLRIKDISRMAEGLWQAVLDERSVRDFDNVSDQLMEDRQILTVYNDSAAAEAVSVKDVLVLIDRVNDAYYLAMALTNETSGGELDILCFDRPPAAVSARQKTTLTSVKP